MTVRVLVVDDHTMLRMGLVQLLATAPDLEVVGEASNGVEAVARAAELEPDVVLMDLQMPQMDGIGATREIVAAGSSQVLVLTSFSDSERIVDVLDAGAVGYVLKDTDPEDLLDAVRAVARGDSPLHPRVARQLLTSRGRAGGRGDLTAREREVLELVRQGLANKQVARRLGITERTVKAHLTSIYSAIGVTDRTSAALWAQRHRGEQP
ncbi:MAG: response regulator transcription factor [Marmoricola sp.]